MPSTAFKLGPELTITIKDSLLLSATCALAVHAIYKQYEILPSSYIPTFMLLILPPLLISLVYNEALSSLFISLLVSFSAFHFTLLMSIIAYRLSPMHPLYRYPGPIIARVSKLWMIPITSKGKINEYVKSLHDRYGKYVRTGPNEISCIDMDVMQDILGPSGMPKGPAWFGYYSFDFMGDMVFGGGFELMNTYDIEGIRPLLRARTRSLATLIHVPWAAPLLLNFSFITGNVRKFREFAYSHALRRKEMGSSVKDIFYHLTNEDGVQTGTSNVTVESILSSGEEAIVAAADTVVNTLTGIFYYLLKHPHELMRVREEVDREFPRGEDPIDAGRLASLEILNAVINETLRLQPVICTYMERAPERGSGGHWLGQRFITEGTAVITPLFTIHRDPDNFSPYPDEFRPDRWLSSAADSKRDNNWHTNTAAFMPFSAGPANCVGKNLAMVELRMVVAVLVQRFDIHFAEGYDFEGYEARVEDRFITQVGELRVSLSARK